MDFIQRSLISTQSKNHFLVLIVCKQSFGPGTEGLWRPEDTEDDLKELALKELAFKLKNNKHK